MHHPYNIMAGCLSVGTVKAFNGAGVRFTDAQIRRMKTATSLPSTSAPDRDILTFANERGFTAGHDSPEFAHLGELKQRLLSMGGWAAVLREQEPDLEAILSRGVLLDGSDAILRVAEESQCHFNSAMEHLSNPLARLVMTGYALSKDGMWRQHSWIYDKASDTIVETTTRRVGYFGVLLDDLGALTFCTRNVPFSEEAMKLVSSHPAYAEFLAADTTD